MRMTVTLDADVAARLKAVARERRISFKQALNTAVRASLDAERRAGRGFKQYAQAMGLRSGLSCWAFAGSPPPRAVMGRRSRDDSRRSAPAAAHGLGGRGAQGPAPAHRRGGRRSDRRFRRV